VKPAACEGFEKCPFNGFHAPNGEEYAIGCQKCKEEELIAEFESKQQ
jgi:hypothetical protein